MPKRVKSDETASRTMSIMPTAAFICPDSGTQPFQMRRFAQDCAPKTYSCTSRNALKKAKLSEGRLRSNGEAARKGPRRKDAEIAHIKRVSTVGRKNDAH